MVDDNITYGDQHVISNRANYLTAYVTAIYSYMVGSKQIPSINREYILQFNIWSWNDVLITVELLISESIYSLNQSRLSYQNH